jgi:Carboxypeptidase regulatory-like domain
MRVAKAASVVFVYVFCIVGVAWSQVATTSLKGTVYDARGAVVSGASVTLQNSATGFSRSTKTDAQGAYEFLQVPPATYVLTATAEGFATERMSGIQLLVNTPATQNLNLAVAGTATVVEVQGQAEMVNTQDASIAERI